jgi:hypothetical protein
MVVQGNWSITGSHSASDPSIMIPSKYFPIIVVLACVGCGEQAVVETSKVVSAPVAKRAMAGEARAPAASAPERQATGMIAAMTDGAGATFVALQPGGFSAPTGSTAIARKIVYDAQVDLIVESVDPVARKLTSLVQDSKGYIAEQTTTGSPGSQRSMRWRVRVPVEHFDSFVDSIIALGELERNNRTSQDVTEHYYDLEARIKNKRLEEQTLSKILQERSGKLEDVLKIEIELSRVRGEIEQFEGKIRVLENLSSLATLTLSIRERDQYAPPAPVVADFRTQVARAWDGSLLDLTKAGKLLVLWAVSWAIWLPFLLVGAFIVWGIVRWLIRVFVRNLPRIVAVARTPITVPRTPTAGE